MLILIQKIILADKNLELCSPEINDFAVRKANRLERKVGSPGRQKWKTQCASDISMKVTNLRQKELKD